MDWYPVPLVASPGASTRTSDLITAPLCKHIKIHFSGADFRGLPCTASQQQAQHSQAAAGASQGPLATYLKRTGKRPPDTSSGGSHNRAFGKVGAGQGGCTKVVKIGGFQQPRVNHPINGKIFAQVTPVLLAKSRSFHGTFGLSSTQRRTAEFTQCIS